jgi:hypothetical protein
VKSLLQAQEESVAEITHILEVFDISGSHLRITDDCLSWQVARSPGSTASAELFIVNDCLVNLKRVRLKVEMFLSADAILDQTTE